MDIRIGFIISPPLEEVMLDVVSDLSQHYHYEIFIAYENAHAYQLYRDHLDEIDLFIFSGKLFLYMVSCREDISRKPCFSLDDSVTNVKDVLLELLLENRSLDLSRIFIDTSDSDHQFMQLRELLPVSQQPQFLDMNVPELTLGRKSLFDQKTLESFTEYVYQKHVTLHKSGAVDLSLTRFGTLPPHFERLGIPYRYIHPSKDAILNFVSQILDGYRQRESEKPPIGAVVIRLFGPMDTGKRETLSQCEKAFVSYSSNHGIDYSITRTKDSIEVIMTAAELYEFTDSLKDVQMIEAVIQPRESSSAYAGIGFGKTITEAKFNAYAATEVGKGSTGRIYSVSGDSQITGPLDGYQTAAQPESNLRLRELSQQLGVDHRNLQKITAFARACGTKTVTSEDIARHLQITPRSANRILSRIAANRGANVFKENWSGGRGRPRNCYELIYLDELT